MFFFIFIFKFWIENIFENMSHVLFASRFIKFDQVKGVVFFSNGRDLINSKSCYNTEIDLNSCYVSIDWTKNNSKSDMYTMNKVLVRGFINSYNKVRSQTSKKIWPKEFHSPFAFDNSMVINDMDIAYNLISAPSLSKSKPNCYLILWYRVLLFTCK